MNWKEVFSWYWEQKGVENPERFPEEDEVDENKLALVQNILTENSNLQENIPQNEE